MALHKLNPRKAATAGPGRHEDGGGLRLVVSKAGTRKWVFRYTFNGKRREMGLGPFPDVGLADARGFAHGARLEVRAGRDPIEARNAQTRAIPTFTECAARFIRSHRHGWRNRKHARQWVSTLKTYARPVIGSKKVDTITTEDILTILSSVWKTKTETAKRVQGRIENILDFAAAQGLREAPNPARWRGHLNQLLPRPARVRKVVHHPAMPYLAVPGFLSDLSTREGISPRALAFLILTATRTGETLGATWDEIDLAAALWTIPAERMKARREHRVPLSPQVMSIVNEIPRYAGNPHVFPGARRGRPLSGMSLLQVMRGMGYGAGGDKGDFVPHGFRSSFRDWAGEVSSFPSDVCEAALAHVISDKTVAAYHRGDMFEKRRRLMDSWAGYLDRQAGRVTNFRRPKAQG